jgi:hypothetical protein
LSDDARKQQKDDKMNEQYEPTSLGDAPCPSCGGTAQVVGGTCFGGNSVDHIQCACGYRGDQFEEDGILFDIVPNGNEDDYVAQYNKIKEAAAKF